MSTVKGRTNLPESERAKFGCSVSVSVPFLFTGLAVYSVFTFTIGGEHFRNSPMVWMGRFYVMSRTFLDCREYSRKYVV